MVSRTRCDIPASDTPWCPSRFFFFFNDTATTEIYTLSLHDALPIFRRRGGTPVCNSRTAPRPARRTLPEGDEACRPAPSPRRSEEHTSELQSQSNLVCRLLLEKKKNCLTLTSDSACVVLSSTTSNAY